MGHFPRSQMRKLNEGRHVIYKNDNSLDKLLLDYLNSKDKIEKAKEFATSFRGDSKNNFKGNYVDILKVKYQGESIVINMIEKNFYIVPFGEKEKGISEEITFLLDRVYLAPKSFDDILKYDSPEEHVEELKKGMLPGLDYIVGTTSGTGIIFHLEGNTIYYRYKNRNGKYPREKVESLFKKIGVKEEYKNK